MKTAAQKGFINATDLADYLVGKGLPFHQAYKTVGQCVGYCVKNGTVLEEMTLDEYKQFDDDFDEGLYAAIDLENCVEKRVSKGGTGKASVLKQIAYIDDFLQGTR